MFIFKKKYNELINRIEQLEKKTTAHTFDFGVVDLEELCRKLPEFVDKRIAADKCKSSTAGKELKKIQKHILKLEDEVEKIQCFLVKEDFV